ncbi:hypothetical protein GGS24DRAFT_500586 [Hypoxylon argillaceum]|nr:hypothetical protein GGS24DRAFT_500586 [Hypoxylon argillaceum]
MDDAVGEQAEQGYIDPSMLHTVYPSSLFCALWRGARDYALTFSPLDPIYEYCVVKMVRLRDVDNRILQYNLDMPHELSITESEIVGIFNNLHDANECAMVLYNRLQTIIRGRSINYAIRYGIGQGHLLLEAKFHTNNYLTIAVSRRPMTFQPIDQPGMAANSQDAQLADLQ